MIDKVKSTVEKYNLIPNGAKVVVALSGGSDSMALLAVLNTIKKEYSIELSAAHVNHCLRGADADRDEEFVVSKCEELGIPVHVLRADVAAEAKKHGEGLEECGRRIRYEFFASFGEDAVIATAHNLSDRVETFLFNFSRGSALRGLCSIPARRGNIVRPLIECTKAEIVEFCAKNSIGYVTDDTNSDVKYSRNRIRHNVVTEFSAINPSFELTAGRCIDAVNEDESFLSSLADELVDKAGREAGFDAAVISAAANPVKKRALIKIAEKSVGVTPEQKFIPKLCALLEKSGSIQINGGVTVRVRKGLLDFPQEIAEAKQTELFDGAEFSDFCIRTEIINIKEMNNLQNVSKQGLEYFLDYDKIHGSIIVRSREAGDKISLKSRGCTKSLKKLFNELSVSPEKRAGIAVFADESGVVLVEGVGCDSRASVSKETERVLAIRFIKR